MTTEADRQQLLRIAREAIVAHVTGSTMTAPSFDPLQRAAGVFVTIYHLRDLRGCIGNIDTNQPLARAIRECAVAACSADPRFSPVTAAELPGLSIEVSLLGPRQPVASADDVEVGRHGLVVEAGLQRGLLLPQVATEWRWNRETFLAQTCHKAGLPRDAWKHGAKVWRFDAEVFGEDGGKGR